MQPGSDWGRPATETVQSYISHSSGPTLLAEVAKVESMELVMYVPDRSAGVMEADDAQTPRTSESEGGGYKKATLC